MQINANYGSDAQVVNGRLATRGNYFKPQVQTYGSNHNITHHLTYRCATHATHTHTQPPHKQMCCIQLHVQYMPSGPKIPH